MKFFGRRGAVLALSLALFAASVMSSGAQPQEPSAPNRPQAPEAAAPKAAPPETAAPSPAQPSEAPGRAQAPEAAAPDRAQLPETPFAELFAQLAGRVVGVVVNISTQAPAPPPKTAQDAPQNSPGPSLDEFFRDFFGDKSAPGSPNSGRVASLGSGFIIDPSGLIVTNNHVIATADQITVTLSDDTTFQAQVIGRDAVTDLALLKIDAKTPLPAASWGDSGKTRVGDWVLAIGNPFGLGGTVTAGIVSARGRDIHQGQYDDFIQTDAAINRGNSGGPLFNMDGQVIGINTAIFSPSGGSIGIGFSIPSNMAKLTIAQLKQFGHARRGWLGVKIQQVTPDIAESLGLKDASGAMVAEIGRAHV